MAAPRFDPRNPSHRWKSAQPEVWKDAAGKPRWNDLRHYLFALNDYIAALEAEKRLGWETRAFGVKDLDQTPLDQIEDLLRSPHLFPTPWAWEEASVLARDIPEYSKVPLPCSEDDPVGVARIAEYNDRSACVCDFYGSEAYHKANARLIVALRNNAQRLLYLARLGQESLEPKPYP